MNALDYLMSDGVISEECNTYKEKTGKCSYKCEGNGVTYKKHYCKPGSLKVMIHTDNIKRELMKHGPLMIGLTVYEDLINYYDGDYKFVSGRLVGGHAVKLMGWRTTIHGKTSWLIQNQWSEDWGQEGFGYIQENEVGIDSVAIGCSPDIENEKSSTEIVE